MLPAFSFLKKALPFCLILLAKTAFGQWIFSPSGTTANLRCVDATDALTVFSAGENVFLKSGDGGLAWQNLPIVNAQNVPIGSVFLNEICFFNTSVGVAVGEMQSPAKPGIILRTTDGGEHWAVSTISNGAFGAGSGLNRVFFLDSQLGWACGKNGTVLKTTDSGLNWQILPNNFAGGVDFRSIRFVSPQTGFLTAKYGVDAGEWFRTIDGGQTWATIANLNFEWLNDQSFISSDTCILGSSQSVFRSNNGSFSDLTSFAMPDQKGAFRIQFFTAERGFALAPNSIRFTKNGGQFWEKQNFSLPNNSFLRDFKFLGDEKNGWLVGDGGLIFRTTNGGDPLAPMAFFEMKPASPACKDSLILLKNTAPEADFQSRWKLDGAFFSAKNDTSIVFAEAGKTHEIRLIILKNGQPLDSFSRTFTLEPSLDFTFGTAVLEQSSPVCEGVYLIAHVQNPAPDAWYFLFQNGQKVGQGFANGAADLPIYSGQPVGLNPILEVRAVKSNACGEKIQSQPLSIQVVGQPDLGFDWQVLTPVTCFPSAAKIVVKNAEPQLFYRLVQDFGGPISAFFEGTGGDLEFDSYPIQWGGNFLVEAQNSLGCGNYSPKKQPIQVETFLNELDTLHLYGFVGEPIQVKNPTQNLGPVSWNFAPQAQASSLVSPAPTVVFSEAGLFPYTYIYASGAGQCTGQTVGEFEIFAEKQPLANGICHETEVADLPFFNSLAQPGILDQHTDPFGHTWLTGCTEQAVNWWLTSNLFLKKFDAQGNLLFEKQVRGDDPAHAFGYRSSIGTSLASDAAGNAFLCGSYFGPSVNLFGATFLTDAASGGADFGGVQGFLMKMGPSGDILWKARFASATDYEVAVPTSMAFDAAANRLYVVLRATAWKAFFPDGTSHSATDATAICWLVTLDGEGHFISKQPVGDWKWTLWTPPFQALETVWHPATASFFGTNLTHLSPRIKLSTGGTVAISGVFQAFASADFGPFHLKHLDSSGTTADYTHFIARLRPSTGEWLAVFPTHTNSRPYVPSYLDGLNDCQFPAWEIDAAGNAWVAFGLNSPWFLEQNLAGSKATIAPDFSEKSGNRSYLARFDSLGNRLWWSRHTNIHFTKLVRAGAVWAMGSFVEKAGFHSPADDLPGYRSMGKKDVFLLKINGNGEFGGLKLLGSAENDQPVGLSSNSCGPLVATFFEGIDSNFISTGSPLELQILDTGGGDGDCSNDCPFLFNPTLPGQTICAFSTVHFAALANGPGLLFQWQIFENGGWQNVVNSAVFSGATTATLTVNLPGASLNGSQFRCQVVDNQGLESLTNAATLTVKAAPFIQNQPADFIFSAPTNAVFEVQATGQNLVFQWEARPNSSWDWQLLPNSTGFADGATTAKLTRLNVDASFSGNQFRCRIKNSLTGCEAVTEAANLLFASGLDLEPTTGSFLKNSWPNPFSETLNLSLDLPESGEVGLRIFHSTGQPVFEKKLGRLVVGEQNFRLDLSETGLPSGVFWVEIFTEKQRAMARVVRF